jgi:hypothetical protein
VLIEQAAPLYANEPFGAELKQAAYGASRQSQARRLRQLNPLLRGWANDYRNGAAQRTFDRLDHYVFGRLSVPEADPSCTRVSADGRRIAQMKEIAGDWGRGDVERRAVVN